MRDFKSPTFHFHSDVATRDCDGPVERESVIEEWGGLKGRDAWTLYVSMRIQYFGINDEFGSQVMRRWTDKYGTERMVMGGPSDEGGYHWEEVRSCTDEYCLSSQYRRNYRDHYAEAAGY